MTTADESTERRPVDRAGRREWVGLAVLALPALLASLELTVTHLALPAISADLQPSSTQLLWIVDIYAFLLAGSMLTMGTLGDRIGRRRLLMAGAFAYGVASVLAAYSTNANMLIATRALLGIAGATLMPSVLSLTATMFRDPRQRAVAISAIIASVSAGTAIGPLVGGAMLERFWWGSVFLLGVPVMAVILVLGPKLLPEYRSRLAGRLDLNSVVLSSAAVLSLVYGLKQIAADGLRWPSMLAVVAGLAVGIVFVRRQRRLPEPVVDLALFADRRFTASLATLALGIFVLWGAIYYLAQYLQLVHGLSPLQAGLWTAPSAFGVIAGSTLAPRLARRLGTGVVIGSGLALSAVGFGVLTQLDVTSGLAVMVTGSVIVSTGLGPMMALATNLVVGAAPPAKAGAASAMSSMAPQLGGAFGIAVLGSVITAVYRGEMAGRLATGLPGEVAEAATDNLGRAVVAAERVPGPAGEAVLVAARESFARGLNIAAALSVALMVGLAVVVVALFRRIGRD